MSEDAMLQLGREVHQALSEVKESKWPISLYLLDHKRAIMGLDPDQEVLFTVKFPPGFSP